MTPLQWEQRRLERNRWERRKVEMTQEVEKEKMNLRTTKRLAAAYLVLAFAGLVYWLPPDARIFFLHLFGILVFALSIVGAAIILGIEK